MRTRKFEALRAEIDADPNRRARVDEMKRAMRDAVRLAKLRQDRHLSQQTLARRLGLSQARVSQIEHGEDLYLSTLGSYVAALGGRLRVEAVFADETVWLTGPHDEPDVSLKDAEL